MAVDVCLFYAAACVIRLARSGVRQTNEHAINSRSVSGPEILTNQRCAEDFADSGYNIQAVSPNFWLLDTQTILASGISSTNGMPEQW